MCVAITERRGELGNQKAARMQLIRRAEAGIEGIRWTMFVGRIVPALERGVDLPPGWLDLDRTDCGRCKNRKELRPHDGAVICRNPPSMAKALTDRFLPVNERA